MSFEPHPEHTRYEDWELYEVLKHDYERVARFDPKCYMHMKLVKREWLHRQGISPNDRATSSYPAPGNGGQPAPRSGCFALWPLLRRVARRHGNP